MTHQRIQRIGLQIIVTRKEKPLPGSGPGVIIVPARIESIGMHWKADSALLMDVMDAPMIRQSAPDGPRIIQDGGVMTPLVLRLLTAHPKLALGVLVSCPLIQHLP